MTAAYETHNLFVHYGIFHFCRSLDFYLCSPANDRFKPIVAVGFGLIQTKQEREIKIKVKNARPDPPAKEDLDSWYGAADYALGANFCKLFEQKDPIWDNSRVAKEWEKTESVQTRGRQR
ncbi:hypothetical protein JCM3765_002297 [Sporobolomyces pararoseus]